MKDRFRFRAFYQGRFIYKSLTDANYYDKDNKCIGCFKGGMGYWNKIKKDFPDVFKAVSDLEVETKHTCLKKDGKPLYLKDLKPDDGNHTDIKIPECDLFCDLELSGLKDKKIEEIIKLL